jgi:hypothetical protein
MAAGPITLISDVIVPEIFTPYAQQMSEQKSRIIQSGAAVIDPAISALLAGGGLTFNVPSWKDLDDDAERVSTDEEHAEFGGAAEPDPFKIGTSQEVAVRLSRNASWSAAQLTGDLAGDDPMQAIANRVSAYWAKRRQAAFVATISGLFKDNAAAPDAAEHTTDDMTVDISGVGFVDGVTNFSADAFVDAAVTMGDSMEALTMLMVHSVVYARMQKNNLIDFVPDSTGLINIPTFLNREVVVDDGVPFSSSVFESWLFGAGAVRIGSATPAVPTEVEHKAGAGNGGGQDILYNRVIWSIHPVGNKYDATSPNGGPSNANTTNNLNHAGSWKRVFPERKQIKIARLITRES